MKQLLLSVSILISVNSFGQITIDDTDMPQTDDTLRWSFATDPTIDPTALGTNITWDFSHLTPISQEVDTFYAVSATPLLYQAAFNNFILYPNHVASHATHEPDQDLQVVTLSNFYSYFKSNSSSYQNVGFAAEVNGAPLPVRNDTIENVYEFPMNYNDTWNSSLYYEAALPTIGYNSQHKQVINTVEGWGTVITPMGSFDALKIKKVINTTDSVYLDLLGFGQLVVRPIETRYIWLAKGEGIPVMEIAETDGDITEIKYKDVKHEILSVSDFTEENIQIYPNPSSDFITIKTDKKVNASIYNLLGKEVLRSNTNNMSIKKLKKGTYLIKIEIEGVVYTRTFIRK